MTTETKSYDPRVQANSLRRCGSRSKLSLDKDRRVHTSRCLHVVINKRSGVAQKGQHTTDDKFFDYWFPLPTFRKEK